MDQRGRVLGNRYELLVPLASGGMGRVWRGRDILLERPVAVKVLREELAGDGVFRARFRAEAQHTAALHHPNIASVFDYGEQEIDGECVAYLVMELVEGEALSTLLEREGRLEPARTLDVLRQTAAALAAAHAAGVVHRDVKPGNVLVGADGTVKIADFGIAWSASSVPLTGTGQVVGTAHYLAPEQAEGAKASPASDVYALGTVAYECLAGHRAFDGENSVQIALKQIREEPLPLPGDVPPGIRAVVERAMAKDPAVRYADGAALRDAVEAAATWSPTVPVAGPEATGTTVLSLADLDDDTGDVRRGRRATLGVLAGVVTAAAAVLLVVGTFSGGGAPVEPASAGTVRTTAPATSSADRTPDAVTADDAAPPTVAETPAQLPAPQLELEGAASDVSAPTPAAEPPAVPPVQAKPHPVEPAPPVVSQPAPPPAGPGHNNGNGHGKGNGRGHGKG